MSQFRWITKVLVGTWQSTYKDALCDALNFGQAVLSPLETNLITLRPFATMQKRPRVA